MIAPQGRNIVSILSVAIIIAHLAIGIVVWPLWGLVVVITYLYRDPNRAIPSAPLGIVSPVDGQVIKIDTQFDPFLKREALTISLQMNWYGVFVLRSVTEGKIMQHWLHEPDKEDDMPGRLQHAIWIQTDEEDDAVIAIHAGGRFRKMHCYASTGERVGQGKRCGFIPFGTRIDIILPTRARSSLAVGDKVIAGQDLIAEFVH